MIFEAFESIYNATTFIFKGSFLSIKTSPKEYLITFYQTDERKSKISCKISLYKLKERNASRKK